MANRPPSRAARRRSAVVAKSAPSPAPEPTQKVDEEDEEKAINSGSLSGGGKQYPKQGLPGGSGLDTGVQKSLYIPIMKAAKERRTLTGVVLEPDTVDAHGDIIPADVILDAAEDFMANINVTTTLGLMHKDFAPPLQLVQSFVVSDMDITINNVVVKKGSWVIVVRVLDDKVWKQVQEGKLTGFSIGGKAQTQDIGPKVA